MTARPLSLIVAAGLLILIGASGMAAGGGLLGVGMNGGPVGSGADESVTRAAIGLGTGIAGYGFAAVLAGVGLILLRRWAWRTGVFLIVLGFIALGGASAAIGTADPVLLLGVIIWGLTLACLFAGSTRDALAAAVAAPRPPA